MYVIRTATELAQLVDEYAADDTALYVAIRRTSTSGIDVIVTEERGAGEYASTREIAYIEADTKVDDTDPFFPVIVHWRDEMLVGPSTGAQC